MTPDRIRRLVWAVVCTYIPTLAYALSHGTGNRVLLLLALQHLLLLPVMILCLRTRSEEMCSYQPPVRLAALLAVLIVVAAASTSFYIGHGVTISDESVYRFQAEIFASGRVAAEPLPGADVADFDSPAHFEHHVYFGSRWFGKYPPGWPAVLALAAPLHLMPLLNPIIGAMVIGIVALIASRYFGRMAAALSVLVILGSPFFLANIVETMPHPACALFVALAAYFCLAGLSDHRTSDFWLAFGAVGVACLIRPLTGLAVGVALGGWSAYHTHREGRPILPLLTAISITGSLALACSLGIQHYYTGSFFRSPYSLAAGASRMAEIDLRPESLVSSALGNSRREVFATLLFTTPFWVLLAGYGIWREPAGRSALIALTLPFIALVAFYLVQPDKSGGTNGCRYYFEGFCLAAVAAGRGMTVLLKRWRPARSAVLAMSLALGSLQLAAQITAYPLLLRHSGPSREVWKQVDGPERVVFLSETENEFIPKFCNWNSPDWRHAAHVFLVDPGPLRREAWAARFGETRWRVVRYHPEKTETSVGYASPSP